MIWIIANWRIVVIALLFVASLFTGWHLRGNYDDSKQQKAFLEQAKTDDKQSTSYEKSLAEINALYNNLDTKPTYENSYSCTIPADGLRLLRAATN